MATRRLLMALLSHALLPLACLAPSQTEWEGTATETATCATTPQVCGVDGRPYANECAAWVAGVAVDHATTELECDETIRCGDLWPVCGTDGRDYDSPCHATRAGVSVAHEGACGAATGTASSEETGTSS